MASAFRAEPAPRPVEGRGDTAQIIAFPERDPGPATLVRLLEQDIIPRLVLSHSDPGAVRRTASPGADCSASTEARQPIGHAEVAAFAEAAVLESAESLVDRVEEWRARGFDDQTLCLELLAPTAKLLGYLWEEDLCGFADVTLGLVRLQQVLHALSGDVEAPFGGAARNALFALFPGEQHGFGLLLAADTFRRSGWRVATATETTEGEILRLVAAEAFDLIGLSAVVDRDPMTLRALILDLRRRSLNRDVRIMVGGRVFDLRPDLVTLVGADAGGEDAPASLATAEKLVPLISSAGLNRV